MSFKTFNLICIFLKTFLLCLLVLIGLIHRHIIEAKRPPPILPHREGKIQVPFVDPFARGRWFFIIPISCEKVRPCACSDRRRCANFPNHCVRCNNDALRCRTAQVDDGLIAADAYRWEGMSSIAVSVQRRAWVGISDALANEEGKSELIRVVLTFR
ncbi:hypothetical protein TNCV_2245261 [Trichonephila clavipes]|nr:hypothetical protein TNCV_2245261 [Trichonephila clavipes]